MQDNTAEKLNVIGAFSQGPSGSFPGEGVRLRQQEIEGFPFLESVSERLGDQRKLFSFQTDSPGFLGIDLMEYGKQLFQVPFELGSEKDVQEVHGTNVKEDPPAVKAAKLGGVGQGATPCYPEIMKSRLAFVPIIPVFFLMISCAPETPQLMPKESLFSLELGTLEDQIDLFERADLSSPERNRFLFFNGLVMISDGNARKIMEFSSYGDLLTLFYNPEANPVPALVGSATNQANPGQVKNRRAFAYPFHELGEMALTDQNQLFVEDRIPTERRIVDPALEVVLESRVLRFDRDGRFLDFLGQEGIGGNPFPQVERLTVTASGDLVVICRTGKGWAVWWYDPQGNPVDTILLPLQSLPLPDGWADKGLLPQMETIFADWHQRRLYMKVDYFQQTMDATTRTASGIQQAQSRIWTYDLAKKSYQKSYVLPVLKRQKTQEETVVPWGDRPFEFLGVSEGGAGFFLSSPEAGRHRFLVCRADGSTILERNIDLDRADILFSQFTVTRTGVLVGFLSDGNRAQIAWWRSDKLLGTYAQTGF